MEVSRLVEILVACSVRASAAPASTLLVEFFPLPVCVDLPQSWHAARSALTHPDLPAIVRARQARKPMASHSVVELARVMADFYPWPRAAVGLGVVCSFPLTWCPVKQEEKGILRVKSSMRRESVVEQMKLHRDWQTRAVVKA